MLARHRSFFHLNTMSAGNGRDFFNQLMLNYAIHFKRPFQELMERGLGLPFPFKWRKRSLDQRRQRVHAQLDPRQVCRAFAAQDAAHPADVVGLSEVLKSQHDLYREFFLGLGFSSVHFGIGHTPKGIKDPLTVMLASRQPSEVVPLSTPFPWVNSIGGGGGAVQVRFPDDDLHVLYLHLATTEKRRAYAAQLQVL
ncbi:MAG: hypothetical protein H7831_05505, partial [Magnetococcus sp. WYHC-3]